MQRTSSLLIKLLGVLWAAAALYLFYGIYGNSVMAKTYPDGAAGFQRLSIFFGITGLLSLVVAGGLYRPGKVIWFLALGLCAALGWYWLQAALYGALVPVIHLLLYIFTAVYLAVQFRLFFGSAPPKIELQS